MKIDAHPWDVIDSKISKMSILCYKFMFTLGKISGRTSIGATKFDIEHFIIKNELKKAPWFKETSLSKNNS